MAEEICWDIDRVNGTYARRLAAKLAKLGVLSEDDAADLYYPSEAEVEEIERMQRL